MRSTLFAVLFLMVSLLVVSSPLLAHHGAAGYDLTKQTVLKATITEFIWSNPHSEVYFDVKDDKGNVQHWIIEAPPPTMLVERGWNRKSLKAGDVVTLYVSAAKNGSPSGRIVKAVLANGDDLWAFPPPELFEKLTTPQK